ncbi:MAG: UDP-N-acetylmuramoyl-L-alanyl-D-glutamate--2,6-diaminopimelate ligase [Candidatus Saccharibacteria bacterium]
MASLKKQIKLLLPSSLFKKLVPIWHLSVAVVANVRYGFPSRSMHVIGVTGTNGKTTTSFMIHTMLSNAGFKSGLMTTVAYGVGDDIVPQVAHMTTASAPLLQKRLAEFKKQGVEWVVLETTSHALVQHRVWGIPYEIAVMTNITHEHLDYHGTFEHYIQAKRRLFEIAGKHGMKLGIVNADDENAAAFEQDTKHVMTYGIASGDLRASDVVLQPDGSQFKATIDGETYAIHCNIPGEFNVSNSLAAVAVGRSLGLSPAQIESGLNSLSGVEGRMDVVSEGQAFSVIVDFAHTPDSFERLLKDVRTATKGELIILFGSAGRRDETKRAIQGEIAGRFGDELVLTEEDDRDIDGNEILKQIAGGAAKAGKVQDKNMHLILDRTKAIEFALSLAHSRDDTVMLLGKGHEKTIERADGEHPWDEVATVRQALKNL